MTEEERHAYDLGASTLTPMPCMTAAEKHVREAPNLTCAPLPNLSKTTPRTELATESHVFSGDDNQEEEEAAAAAGADTHRSSRRWDGLGGDNGPKGADKQYA